MPNAGYGASMFSLAYTSPNSPVNCRFGASVARYSRALASMGWWAALSDGLMS